MNNIKFLLKLLSIFMIVIFLNGCNVGTINDNKTAIENKKPERENFDEFYKKFYTDSVFQLTRIKFPLRGYYMNFERAGLDTIDDRKDNYEWDKEKWMNTPSVSDTDTMEYKINRIITDTIVTREIIAKRENMKIVEAYKLIDGKWFLVHYVFWFL